MQPEPRHLLLSGLEDTEKGLFKLFSVRSQETPKAGGL
jgi:hypothetical protein